MITIRPALGEESLLVGRVKDEEQVRKVLAALVEKGQGQIINGPQDQPDHNKEFTALLTSGFLVLGKTENMLVYLDQLRNGETISPDQKQSLARGDFAGAAVVTYTNDPDSVSSVLTALARLSGQPVSQATVQSTEDKVAHLDVSTTESRLNENGIDRRTVSAFGQFGNLLSLAVADSSTPKR
jgi:hypothetical protein